MHRIIFLILIMSLASCANFSLNNSEKDWNTHYHQLSTLEYWDLQGRLNIRSEHGSDTLNFNWLQDEDSFTITLSAAFGLSSIKLEGDQNSVTIEQAGKAPVTAKNLEEASRLQLGIEFPAHELYYWIRGIPQPNQNYHPQFDNKRLSALEQNDQQDRTWHLTYERYEDTNAITLPGRIKAQYDDYRLTFSINRWNLK